MVKARSYFKCVSSSEQPVHYGTRLYGSRDLSSLCNATECGNLGFQDVFIPHESQRESNIGSKDNYKRLFTRYDCDCDCDFYLRN